jgi:hypothetical protein
VVVIEVPSEILHEKYNPQDPNQYNPISFNFDKAQKQDFVILLVQNWIFSNRYHEVPLFYRFRQSVMLVPHKT